MSPDTKPFIAVSRWKRPRLYLTIVSFFLIISSVTIYVFLYLQSTSIRLDAGGAYGALAYPALMGIDSVLYLILGNVAAVLLLRKRPSFILAIAILLTWIVFTSFMTYLITYDFLNYCNSSLNTSSYHCAPIGNQFSFWLPLFALVSAMFALLYIGRREYIKTVRQVQ